MSDILKRRDVNARNKADEYWNGCEDSALQMEKSFEAGYEAGFNAGIQDEVVMGLREALELAQNAFEKNWAIDWNELSIALAAYDDAIKQLEIK